MFVAQQSRRKGTGWSVKGGLFVLLVDMVVLGLAEKLCFPFPFSHLLDLAELDAVGSDAALLL